MLFIDLFDSHVSDLSSNARLHLLHECGVDLTRKTTPCQTKFRVLTGVERRVR